MILVVLCFVGCVPQQDQQERHYTVYVDLRPEEVLQDNVEPHMSIPTPEVTPEATPEVVNPTPSPTPTPLKHSKPQPKATVVPKAVEWKSAQSVSQLYNMVMNEMDKRGLLVDDVKDGRVRLGRVDEAIQRGQNSLAENLLHAFGNDFKAIIIDETFITQKNARLLEKIQEVKPSADLQAQIDRDSEAINQLLENSDYAAINRRLNDLFKLLETAPRTK
jgi:hypothetical protein